METKKRDGQQGFRKFRRENIDIRTQCDVLETFVDKFSLIKARRRRTEQNRKREYIFKAKKPLKESRKSPIFDSSDDDAIEINGNCESYERSVDFEHFTIDLKRVGIDSNEDRIEEKLLASSISPFFKKRPNISIHPIDQKDLKILSTDGFIKTETFDKMNKENTPTSLTVCNDNVFPKKTVIITSEHLTKIKSKLKAVSYEKSIAKSPSTQITKENEFDGNKDTPSLPNLEVENHTSLFSYCDDGLQPPTLLPEMKCTTETPIVYLETKPDVTELDREMTIQDTPTNSRSDIDGELTENEDDNVINCSEVRDCQRLDVFVAEGTTEGTMKLENDSKNIVDLMLTPLQRKSRSTSTESDNRHSKSDSEMNDISPSLAITTTENQVPNTDSLIIDSNSHSNHSCKTSSISHPTNHFTTNTNSLHSLHESSSRALPSSDKTSKMILEQNISRSVCKEKKTYCQNAIENKSSADCSEDLSMCAEPLTGELEENKQCQGVPIIHPIPTNKNSNGGSCLVAKEPSEAACVNGYDSDATYVYDDDDYERDNLQSDKLVKDDIQKASFSTHCLSDPVLKIKNSEGVAKLKKTFYKTLSLHKFSKSSPVTSTGKNSLVAKPKAKKARNILKIKLTPKPIKRKNQTKSKTDSISKDLTLTISPRKNGKHAAERKKLNKTPQVLMKLHDVFNFDECDDAVDGTKTLKGHCLIKNDSTTKKPMSKKQSKKKTIRQGINRRKRTSDICMLTTTILGAIENTDEDDLPKILPPKRRRNAKCSAAMKNKPIFASNDMERLIQEFPRHNWLENKYKTDETTRDPSQEANISPETYEYSLDEEKMQSIETVEHLAEKRQITTDVPAEDVETPISNSPVALTPGSQVNTSDSVEQVDKQDDQTEDDRLQIVTDEDQNHQEMEIRIPSADCTSSDDMQRNHDINEIKENNSTVEDETTKTCDGSGEYNLSAEEQVDQTPKSDDNVLPPVPQLIRAPDINEDTLPSYDEVETRGTRTSSTSDENQGTVANLCTSAMEMDNSCDLVGKSFSVIPDSTLAVPSNRECVVSPNQIDGHVTNARKRKLVECEEIVEQGKLIAKPAIPDHVPLKSPKIQGPAVMDIVKFKEIIAAKVKNDIDHQLQKTLKEIQELDQLASEKAREAESLKKLREKKLRDLQQIQQNNSEMEIKRVLNEKLRNMDRKNDFNFEMNSPPPAHQRPKQNIRELLEKMDRSHSQTPIDCPSYSAYSTRKTPLHSPKSVVDSKRSNSAHSQLPSVRNDVSRNEASISSNNIPHAHETEKSCDTRASSAPISCYNQNGLNNQLSLSEARQSALYKTSIITSSSTTNGVKQNVNPNTQGNTYIDLSQRNTDSEVEIQRELSRALAAKRQKQDINIKHDVSKTRDVSVIREPQQAEDSYPTRYVFHPSNAHQLHNKISKDVRGANQYPSNTYPDQLVRQVSYGGIINPQNQPLDRLTKCSPRLITPSMVRPHAVRLLGATALGNGQQPMDGRQAYHSYASSIPRNTYHNTGSIQQGTPIRPVSGIVSPTQSNTRSTYSNGVQGVENSQILRHIPITAARTIEDPQRDSYVQAAISSLQPTIRPRGYMRPLVPASSVRVHPTVPPTLDHNTQKIPHNNEVLITQSQQQTNPNMHMNVNGKCIVCSKFALYLCSKCQQFWYCSPQCQLKHWVTHQHQCKNSTDLS